MGNWQEVHLKEIYDDLVMGQSPDSSTYNEDLKGLPFVQGNADMEYGVPKIRIYTSDPKKISELGDVLLSVRAPVGDLFKNNLGQIAIGRGISAIRVSNKSLREYIYQYFTWNKTQFNKLQQGTTFTEIGKREVRNLKINISDDEDEIKAITSILSKVDEAIEASQSSIKAAEKLKKALMQNLLTGKLKPDGTWRTEDEFYLDVKYGKVPVGWSVRAIGDKSHCNINPNYSFVKGNSYDFIPMDGINDGFRGVRYIESRVIEGGGYTRFKLGDILFAKITPCTENGKVALIDKINSEVGFASTEFIVFQPLETIDNLFFYYVLSNGTVHRLAVSLMEGTTGRQRVPWKIFKNRITVAFPEDIEEQKAIAQKIKALELSSVDKQNKIQTLQRLKKSLMQNLLTGKVRIDVAKMNELLNAEN